MEDTVMSGWPYLVFAAAVLFLAVLAMAAWIGKWHREHTFDVFSSSEPTSTEEYHFVLEDVGDLPKV